MITQTMTLIECVNAAVEKFDAEANKQRWRRQRALLKAKAGPREATDVMEALDADLRRQRQEVVRQVVKEFANAG
jgi:hypothetical protein